MRELLPIPWFRDRRGDRHRARGAHLRRGPTYRQPGGADPVRSGARSRSARGLRAGVREVRGQPSPRSGHRHADEPRRLLRGEREARERVGDVQGGGRRGADPARQAGGARLDTCGQAGAAASEARGSHREPTGSGHDDRAVRGGDRAGDARDRHVRRSGADRHHRERGRVPAAHDHRRREGGRDGRGRHPSARAGEVCRTGDADRSAVARTSERPGAWSSQLHLRGTLVVGGSGSSSGPEGSPCSGRGSPSGSPREAPGRMRSMADDAARST